MTTLPHGSIHSPLVPFSADGTVSLDGVACQVRFHVDAGAHGIFVVAHGAESHTLSQRERLAIASAAADEIAGAVPLLVHVSASATADAVELARHAERLGAAAVVVTAPYYWRLSDDAVVEHVAAVARAVDTPIVVYNAPSHQRGADLALGILERVADIVPSWAGVIDGGASYQYVASVGAIIAQRRPDVMLAVEGEEVLPAFLMGARIAVSSIATIVPNLVGELVRAVERDDLDAARVLQDRATLLQAWARPNPIGRLKRASALFGRDLGRPRALVPAVSPRELGELEAMIEEWGLRTTEPHGWPARQTD